MTDMRVASDALSAEDLADIKPLNAGVLVESYASQSIVVRDPSTGRELYQFAEGTNADVDSAVESTRKAAAPWREMEPQARKRVLLRWASLIESNSARLDRLDALEIGKPLSLLAFNALSAANLVAFFAEAVDKLNGDVLPSGHTATVFQKRVPRGVVGAIVPWNFPTYNVALKVAPALAAGNGVVLKPSELANQSPLLLAQLALEAGIPAGAFNLVPGAGEIVGRALGEHHDVDMITFTGSTAVGKLMLRYSAESNMKVISAECGGKSPHIFLDENLDVDSAARSIAAMVAMNQGQVCSIGTRLIVPRKLQDRFVEKMIDHLDQLRPGDPQALTTTYGPLCSEAHFAKVSRYISQARGEGVPIAYGGERFPGLDNGFFLQPAIFVDVPPKSALAREEIFGPILSVLAFDEVEEAIRLARETDFGLAAYIWSKDTPTAFRVANALDTAVTIVNAEPQAAGGPGPAFSGEPHGLSGVGIEGGLSGLETYTRRQTVWVKHG